MPGVTKHLTNRDHGRAFPASRYDDPRGGRASALERNILRYRATEATLFLFYTQEVHKFLLTNVYPAAVRGSGVTALLRASEGEGRQGKKLKVALGYAVTIGILTKTEADELRALLDYWNDIAHRIHLVMSDISRNYWAIDHVAYAAPTYQGEALDRLRAYRDSLWERSGGKLLLTLSMDRMLFELADNVYEQDLKRLERSITEQIAQEREYYSAVKAELDLRGTELIHDLSPLFPANHRSGRHGYGDDYIPATGHLTKRGVEICYRLFDLGKSPTAVAYLMGMTLRSAERRRRSWIKAGGLQRVRVEVERYDLRAMRPLSPKLCRPAV